MFVQVSGFLQVVRPNNSGGCPTKQLRSCGDEVEQERWLNENEYCVICTYQTVRRIFTKLKTVMIGSFHRRRRKEFENAQSIIYFTLSTKGPVKSHYDTMRFSNPYGSLVSYCERQKVIKPEDQWSCKRSPETRDIYQ